MTSVDSESGVGFTLNVLVNLCFLYDRHAGCSASQKCPQAGSGASRLATLDNASSNFSGQVLFGDQSLIILDRHDVNHRNAASFDEKMFIASIGVLDNCPKAIFLLQPARELQLPLVCRRCAPRALGNLGQEQRVVIALVLDTHSVIWLLHADARLSPVARYRIDGAISQRVIAATAFSLGVSLVSRDGRIRDSRESDDLVTVSPAGR